MLAQAALANPEDDGEWEVHWVTKNPNPFRHAKRKAVCQVDGWLLCPSSVGGGCCPPNFECGTASCYATTSGPTSCNGQTGYYNCPLTLGAGSCCPVGLICNDNDGCSPPPGVSEPPSCPANWIACAVSLGAGCCRSGQVCGSGVCYDGTPQTFPISETKTTTDSRGHTTITVVTSMTVKIDGPPTSSGSPSAAVIPQLVPSTIAKLDALPTSDSGGGGGGGLSSGALGGIVTGVIVLLIAIVVAAVFIILRLKKAEKAAKEAEKAAESRRESSNSQPRSHKSGFGQPTISEIDSTADLDSPHRNRFMPRSSRSRSNTASSQAVTYNFIHSDTSSPPLWNKFFHYSSSEMSDDNAATRNSQRVSVDSQGTYGHGRKRSDLSELEGTPGKAELDASESAEAVSQRQSSGAAQPGKTHVRRNSDVSGQNRARGDSNARALGTVREFVELHGHYGPANTLAGQTAASISRGPSTADSSPTHQNPP
ncbi:hypothetical protein F5B22DRAFT_647958 [Xylaria bambusicola]|uniref:uncharacterized protein n=1 Tax=Xylaria bambusicola TaxID=326684 RepID=UPI0020083FEB|nr:uncharacterized protein F5B22DRAFT_647958 [Xylaria bambusicola]KAI0513146.1 hypothetical protein F5B22DRAFT_647958 [Xylaria bambusicola]